jgi:hypothetical protein
MDYSLQKYGPHDTQHVPSDLKEACAAVLLLLLSVLLPVLVLVLQLLRVLACCCQFRNYYSRYMQRTACATPI